MEYNSCYTLFSERKNRDLRSKSEESPALFFILYLGVCRRLFCFFFPKKENNIFGGKEIFI